MAMDKEKKTELNKKIQAELKLMVASINADKWESAKEASNNIGKLIDSAEEIQELDSDEFALD